VTASLAVVPAQGQTFAVEEVQTMAKAAAASGLFASIKTPEAAFTLMMLCQAEGLHPMQALRQYDIIEGKPAKKADAMLADFQGRGGRVDWKQHDHEACEGVFSAPTAAKPETVRWSVDDAKRASLMGKQNWQKYTRQMLRARVISEGIRLTMPGVVVGIYTPEEVQDFDDRPARAQGPADHDYTPPKNTAGTENVPKRETLVDGGFTDPEEEDSRLTAEYTEPVPIYEATTGEEIRREPGITSAQNAKIHALLRDVRNQYSEADYHRHLKKVFSKAHTSELSVREAGKVIDGLLKRYEKIRPEMEAAEQERLAVLAREKAANVDTGEVPTAEAREDLRTVFATLEWTEQQRALWCKERFGHPPESMTAAQFKTAALLLLAWGQPEVYARALAEEQGAGRCK
jgi:hypothetical protein